MKNLKLFILFIAFNLVNAQNTSEHISSYDMISVTYKASPKWSAYAEFQLRGNERYSTFDYYEIKGGVGYNVAKKHQILLGLGRYGTYKNRSISQEEFRLWLQYTFNQEIGKLDLDHRVRAEQRFFHASQTGENTTANRFRYRLSLSYPLNKDNIQKGALFANIFDEVFVGPKDNALKRNRIYSGLGYVISDNVTASSGYLWQREFSNKGNKNLHYLYFALTFKIDSSKEPKTRIKVSEVD
ncbi:DUF2490 domain-containing protein [Elizabethkingia sp. JS20170427COW]|uniref:DUF2490 domain-containing protein n=1 Tax=Elizabethkingia sp. JS20170427COW TaxID=2583851 RepID=UPI0016277AF3|nr:DUF2490 domain-containing protein [Elizabethkingia sp. JS20170427COW]